MATKWLKVAKSGTSPLQRFWKNSEFFKDTLRTKITLRNLLKEIVCENQNFRSDLTVLLMKSVPGTLSESSPISQEEVGEVKTVICTLRNLNLIRNFSILGQRLGMLFHKLLEQVNQSNISLIRSKHCFSLKCYLMALT